MKNYLFVCWQGKSRSPYAAEYFSNILKEKNIEANVISAGITPASPTTITKEMCIDADMIFVMEEFLQKKIINKYKINKRKIVNLNILDIYSFGGIFLESLLSQLQRDKSDEENKEIIKKEEIRNKLNLDDVLKNRHLEAYIKETPSNLLVQEIYNKREWEHFVREKGLIPLKFDEDPVKRRILKPIDNIFNQNVSMLEKWYNKAHSLGLNSFHVKMKENGLELQYLGNFNLYDLVLRLDSLNTPTYIKKKNLFYLLDDIAKQSIELISNYHQHNDLKPTNIMIYEDKTYFVDPSPIPLHNSRYPDISQFVDSLYPNLNSTKALKDESRNIIIFYLKKLIEYGVNIKHPLFKQDLEEKIMYKQ